MMNITIDKTELDVIREAIVEAADCYRDNKTPEVGTFDRISIDLYTKLFSYRDNRKERPLDRPVNYSLVEIFKELKFGRTVDSQKFLTKCIKELEDCD